MYRRGTPGLVLEVLSSTDPVPRQVHIIHALTWYSNLTRSKSPQSTVHTLLTEVNQPIIILKNPGKNSQEQKKKRGKKEGSMYAQSDTWQPWLIWRTRLHSTHTRGFKESSDLGLLPSCPSLHNILVYCTT